MQQVIQLLPDHVANQIAAGEVVQRPASVVKELVENAIDAQANHIKLIIKEAGKTLIQVVDNGNGMNDLDARLCFERHATSKIKKAEDLFDLHTKGFRGEALASIAAIAHVTLETKTEKADLGTNIIIEGSKFIKQDPIVKQTGTTFSVKNLFFNIPARRKFLKSDTIEFRHIMDEFQRIVLAHPSIMFEFYHNQNEVYILPAANLKQRIVHVFGHKINEQLVPIQEDTEIVKISGFICKPEFAKKTKGEQFFFVNDRFIKSGYLHHAISNAFEGLIKVGFQPSYFIYMQVPADSIDINIHPTKTEIKFDEEQSLYAIIRACVKHSLGQYQIKTQLDFDKDTSLELSPSALLNPISIPKIDYNQAFNPFDNISTTSTPKQSEKFKTFSSKKPEHQWDGLYVGIKDEVEIISSGISEEDTNFKSLFDDEIFEQTAATVFQMSNKYIVKSMKSALIFVHQNRAHQRIIYERILRLFTNEKSSTQKLLFAIHLDYNANELLLLEALKDNLYVLGFHFEIVNQHLDISGIPTFIRESQVKELINYLLIDLEFHYQQAISSYDLNDRIAKSIAKSTAIKTGQKLLKEEQNNILDELFACTDSLSSPFNKQIFVNLSDKDIEQKFNA
jgi:DNA mismatch repair protein MutL